MYDKGTEDTRPHAQLHSPDQIYDWMKVELTKGLWDKLLKPEYAR